MVTCEIIWSEPVCPSTQDSFLNYTSFKIIGLESVVMSWITAGIVLLLWVYGTMAGLVREWDCIIELVCMSAVEGNTYRHSKLADKYSYRYTTGVWEMWQYPNPYFIFRQSEMAHCMMICTNTSVCYGKYTSQRVDSSASVVFYYICMSVAHRAGHSSVPLLCPCCQYGMTTLIEVLHLPCPTSCNIGGGCVHWSSIS